MMLRRRNRPGFTLVELLVVIAIISILAALTMAAVQKVRERGRDVQCRSDITQLETALGQFKQRFGIYPPCFGGHSSGAFRLSTNYNSGNPAQDQPELGILLQMFPRMNPADNGLRRLQTDLSPTIYTPANSVGDGIPQNNPILLDPNQCLVFFLSGGIFTNYTGFAANPTIPFCGPFANANIQVSRLHGGPFYDGFVASRMVRRDKFGEGYWIGQPTAAPPEVPTPANPNRFRFGSDSSLPPDQSENPATDSLRREQPWFVDPWGVPYLYCRSDRGNDLKFNAAGSPLMISPWGGTNSPNPGGVQPFFTGSGTATRFFGDKSYQIISGGRDRKIGPGGAYAPGVGLYALNRHGGDDFASFQQTPLGVSD